MKRRPDSIKGRLFLWMSLFTSALLLVLGTVLYLEMEKAVFRSVEHTLHAKIQILKGLIHEEHGAIELELAEIVSGEYSVPRSGHYYKVLIDGEVLAASPSLVDEEFDLGKGELRFHNEQLQESVYIATGPANEPIMVVQHDFEIFNLPATVYVAQGLEESIALITRFKILLLIIIPLNIFAIAIAGFWIVKRALIPLKEFSFRVERITHKTMGERIDGENLARELRGLADSFNAMLDRLETAFNTEKRLIADASHELKTPLSVIKTQCEVLLQKDREREEYIHALKAIQTSSNAMKKLITDMLSLARLDSGEFPVSALKSVSVKDCLDKAVKLVRHLADRRRIKIKLKCKDNIKVMGEENALTEAFLNIIENAVRYNKPDGTVEVFVTRAKDMARIVVKDTGRGIKEGDMEKIFDRFYRGDISRTSEGTGLGLSISKTIVEALGGEITVSSTPDKGSSFFIILPLA